MALAPGQRRDISNEHPDVVKPLCAAYQKYWADVSANDHGWRGRPSLGTKNRTGSRSLRGGMVHNHGQLSMEPISGQTQTADVSTSETVKVFTIAVPAGPAAIEDTLLDSSGKSLCSAYYVLVRKQCIGDTPPRHESPVSTPAYPGPAGIACRRTHGTQLCGLFRVQGPVPVCITHKENP